MARSALTSLKNEDYTDRELLHICNDVANGEGFSTTRDIALQLKIASPKENVKPEDHAIRCVATRFAWMARFGFVERNDDRTAWRVTGVGRDLMNGKLSKGLENALTKLKEGDRVLVMRSLTKGYREGGEAGAIMLRREFTHGARRNGAK